MSASSDTLAQDNTCEQCKLRPGKPAQFFYGKKADDLKVKRSEPVAICFECAKKPYMSFLRSRIVFGIAIGGVLLVVAVLLYSLSYDLGTQAQGPYKVVHTDGGDLKISTGPGDSTLSGVASSVACLSVLLFIGGLGSVGFIAFPLLGLINLNKLRKADGEFAAKELAASRKSLAIALKSKELEALGFDAFWIDQPPKVATKTQDSREIRVGMTLDQVIQVLGSPRDEGISGADLLGNNTYDPRLSDVFLYFDKNPTIDYSIHFAQSKVVSIKTIQK